jgi:hypothetical protein
MPQLSAEQVKKRLQNIEKKKKTLNCDVIMKMQPKDYKTKDGRIEGVQNRLQCNELNLQKKRLDKKLAEMKPPSPLSPLSPLSPPVRPKSPLSPLSPPVKPKSPPVKPKSPPVKKTVASPPVSSSSRRPRGRPPMKCEDIKSTIKIKSPVKKQNAIDKKCAKRETAKYKPYKCKNVDGKCMTISKTYNNPLFEMI